MGLGGEVYILAQRETEMIAPSKRDFAYEAFWKSARIPTPAVGQRQSHKGSARGEAFACIMGTSR